MIKFEEEEKNWNEAGQRTLSLHGWAVHGWRNMSKSLRLSEKRVYCQYISLLEKTQSS